MSQPTSDLVLPARAPRYRRWLVWLVVIVLVPLCLYGWRVVQENQAKKRLATILEQIDANDPGWRLDKLQEEYERREVDHELMKALQAFTRYYSDDNLYAQFWRSPHTRLTSNQLTELRRRHIAPELSTLPAFLQSQRNRTQLRFAEVYRGTPNQRKTLREQFEYLMRYASDEVYLAIGEDRGDAVISALQFQLSLYHPYDGCPSLSVRERGHQLLITCANHVQTMLAQRVYSEVQLARLQKMFNEYGKDSHLSQLRLIRAEANDMLEKMQSDPIYRDDCFAHYFNTSGNSASWVDEVKHNVDDWFRRSQAANTLLEAQAEVLETLEEVMKQARQDSTKVVVKSTWPVTNHVAQTVLRDNYSMIFFQANAQASIRSAIVAVACERFRLKNNQWPKSLDELVLQYLDQVPLDPYSGKPLLFKLLPDGAVVYSVGYDLNDDGGEVLPLGRGGRDRGVRLYDPQHRGKKPEVAK